MLILFYEYNQVFISRHNSLLCARKAKNSSAFMLISAISDGLCVRDEGYVLKMQHWNLSDSSIDAKLDQINCKSRSYVSCIEVWLLNVAYLRIAELRFAKKNLKKSSRVFWSQHFSRILMMNECQIWRHYSEVRRQKNIDHKSHNFTMLNITSIAYIRSLEV